MCVLHCWCVLHRDPALCVCSIVGVFCSSVSVCDIVNVIWSSALGLGDYICIYKVYSNIFSNEI